MNRRLRLRAVADGLQGRFLVDAGMLTGSGVCAAAIVIVQGLLLARWLGPRAYGAVALVSAYPLVIVSLLTPDSPHATIRYLADREAAGDHRGALAVCRVAYLADLLVGALTVVVVAVSAPWAEDHVVHIEGSAGLLVLTAVALLLSAPAHAATATLLHSGRYRTIAAEQVANALLRSGLMIGLVAAGQGTAGAIRGAALGYAAHGLVLAAVAAREERRRWGGSWVRDGDTRHLGALRREMLRFLAWTDLGTFLGTMTKQLDVLVLGWFAGPTEAGQYRLARSISTLPGYLVSPLQAASSPRLAQSYAAHDGSLRSSVRRHAQLGAVVAASGVVGVALLPPVLRLVVGARYDDSVGMAQLLLAGSVLWAACYWLRPLYLAAGWVRMWVAVSSGVVVASLVLFGPAATLWGGLGLSAVQLLVAVGAHAVTLAGVPRILSADAPADDRVRVAGP